MILQFSSEGAARDDNPSAESGPVVRSNRDAATAAAPGQPGAGSLSSLSESRTDQAAELIGVDWGTSNLRIMRIGRGGAILDIRSDARGASRLERDEFLATLQDVAGDWLGDDIPVLVCGMAGARGKWQETGYRDCPAGLADLAPVHIGGAGSAISIVPGVALSPDGQLADVMRGEETQVIGVAEGDGGLVVTPGTHSKWIEVEGDRIARFRTFMTGDLFAAIRSSTILGHGMGEAGVDLAAFEQGASVALSDPALIATLFTVRTEQLADRMAVESAADYLSGLLVGAEIAEQPPLKDRQVTLVGAAALNARYAAALALAGVTNLRILESSEATARGLWRIHEAHRQ